MTINHLVTQIGQAMGSAPDVSYAAPRTGDVRDSLADISAARAAFGFEPKVDFDSALAEYVNWARIDSRTLVAA